jgi:hypothetical protein
MEESIIPWRETGHQSSECGCRLQTIGRKAISREPNAVTSSSKWLWSMMSEGIGNQRLHRSVVKHNLPTWARSSEQGRVQLLSLQDVWLAFSRPTVCAPPAAPILHTALLYSKLHKSKTSQNHSALTDTPPHRQLHHELIQKPRWLLSAAGADGC